MVVRQVACQVQFHTLVDQVGIAKVKAGQAPKNRNNPKTCFLHISFIK